MKRWILHSMFAAAALVAVAGSASAQQALKAEIPFSFRAAGVLMAPGTYDVVLDGNAAHYFRLHNQESHKAVLLSGYIRRDPAKAWVQAGSPMLSFECAGAQCVLRQIWTGNQPAYQFLGPKPTGDEPVRVAEIRMTRASE